MEYSRVTEVLALILVIIVFYEWPFVDLFARGKDLSFQDWRLLDFLALETLVLGLPFLVLRNNLETQIRMGLILGATVEAL